MTDSLETPQDRPLVTFALFAYNQDQYIREAVEGAFSQTYEPLEIILSDDCSSDRTFEIMQEMAAAYEGPHEVKVRQSEVNAGLLNHVLSVARCAASNILIVSAGDDISFPQRTEILCKHFEDGMIYAVSSDDIIIDENGNEKNWDLARFKSRDLWHAEDSAWVHGATAAYRITFLKMLPLSEVNVFYEDMVFSDLIRAVNKRSIRLTLPLIRYRHHCNNLSDRMSTDTSAKSMENKSIERWQRAHGGKIYCLGALSDLAASGKMISYKTKRRLNGEERYLFYAKNLKKNGIASKFSLIYYATRYGNLKAILARMIGPSAFYALKRIKRIHDGA